MKKDDILEKYKDYPEIIDSPVEMNEPNSSIKIFEGEYLIKDKINEIKVNGQISYEWYPNSGAHFSGIPLIETSKLFKITNGFNSFRIIIDGLEFGQGFITNTNFGSFNNDAYIKGILAQQAILGDKSIAIEKLRFSVPNLREFHGLSVKRVTEKNISVSRNRLRLENENFIIILDKCYNYKELYKALEAKGGYIILYGGELTSKKGSILIEDIKDTLHCLDTFLSFLNGRRTSALFIHGVYDNQTIWCDYTNYHTDNFKTVPTWPQRHSVIGLNELWQKFSTIWKDNDDKNFLTTIIHWYVEANGHAGFSEGSIIMAQTALELLYNWWIIENKKLIVGKDSENINASNKIRLLLSQLNISHSVSKSFTYLQSFINESKDIIDAPDAVVQIRNAIVHSQEEKRKKLSAIHYRAKYEALQLCLWYIEMSLLCILDFDDKYFNRCSKELYASKAEEYVPWTKKDDNK